jgi:GNAT superfamily N-acetyltransferase
MSTSVTLREARSEDQPFLLRLYSDVRGPEMSAWGWPPSQRDAFLRMQFEAQRRSWQTAWPMASDAIVVEENAPIGRRLVATDAAGLHLVDIALLAPWRNRGIGSALLRAMLDECGAKGCPLLLHVLRGNPAQRLYERMGFREIDASQMYIQMQWTPGAGQAG